MSIFPFWLSFVSLENVGVPMTVGTGFLLARFIPAQTRLYRLLPSDEEAIKFKLGLTHFVLLHRINIQKY